MMKKLVFFIDHYEKEESNFNRHDHKTNNSQNWLGVQLLETNKFIEDEFLYRIMILKAYP